MLKKLKDLLRRAKEAGSLETVTSLILSDSDDSEFVYIPPGEAMTDASKRRMTSPPAREERELAMSGPEAEKKVGTSPASYGLKLPKGILNVDQWGTTVLTVGKYQKAGFSYQELYSSSRQEHQSYCNWLMSQKHRVDLTAPFKDFVRYLMVVSQDDGDSVCFEDSSVRRQMKTK